MRHILCAVATNAIYTPGIRLIECRYPDASISCYVYFRLSTTSMPRSSGKPSCIYAFAGMRDNEYATLLSFQRLEVSPRLDLPLGSVENKRKK